MIESHLSDHVKSCDQPVTWPIINKYFHQPSWIGKIWVWYFPMRKKTKYSQIPTNDFITLLTATQSCNIQRYLENPMKYNCSSPTCFLQIFSEFYNRNKIHTSRVQYSLIDNDKSDINKTEGYFGSTNKFRSRSLQKCPGSFWLFATVCPFEMLISRCYLHCFFVLLSRICQRVEYYEGCLILDRVSPKESNDLTERKKRDGSGDGRTGRRKNVKTSAAGEEEKAEGNASPSSDPLEPWSTRDIKDMNAILAWRENGPDSPWFVLMKFHVISARFSSEGRWSVCQLSDRRKWGGRSSGRRLNWGKEEFPAVFLRPSRVERTDNK